MSPLLSTLTLGTARQPLPPGTNEWLAERDAVDPTADDAERLLAAWAVQERLRRVEPGLTIALTDIAGPPADERALPSARLSQGIQLIVRGTYPQLMPEVLRLLAEHRIQYPPFLLPELLDRAVALQNDNDPRAGDLLAAAGPRGNWLAGLNPAWKPLADDFDFAAAWATEATPGRRLPLLRRWRKTDPEAARSALDETWAAQSPKNQESLLAALSTNLSAGDLPWLRDKLGPKRRGVRRALFALLLRGGEEQALNDATTLAATGLTEEGKMKTILPEGEAQELLTTYGGLQKKETFPAFLLASLPPNLLPDLLGQTATEFWLTLRKDELQLAAKTLLRYHRPELDAEFVRFAAIGNPVQIPAAEAGELTGRLPQETFTALFHGLLDNEKDLLHFGGLPRLLVLSRGEAWSERITKAFVHQITRMMREVYGLPHATLRDMQLHWRLAIPLVHVSTFGWLRTQLHAMTERGDAFGKLATEMLQTTAFRRQLGAAAEAAAAGAEKVFKAR